MSEKKKVPRPDWKKVLWLLGVTVGVYAFLVAINSLTLGRLSFTDTICSRSGTCALGTGVLFFLVLILLGFTAVAAVRAFRIRRQAKRSAGESPGGPTR